jgi:hypothetical protein
MNYFIIKSIQAWYIKKEINIINRGRVASTYSSFFECKEIQKRYFHLALNKFSNKYLSDLPNWLSFFIFIIFVLLHPILGVLTSYILTSQFNEILSTFFTILYMFSYSISNFFYKNESQKVLNELLINYIDEIKLFEEFYYSKELHYLYSSKQPNSPKEINVNEVLKNTISKLNLTHFSFMTFKRVYLNQNTKELDEFINQLYKTNNLSI